LYGPGDLDAVARRIAAELGVTPEEVLAGTEEIGERCRVTGAVSLEDTAAFVGAELGMTAQQVLTETRAWLEAVR
jgi:hypothetical protein